ncbi:hypothetical protein [Streptomyces sp. H27-C3]|uniref:hypothetical protein n=1 Tax=Streptomyces sp. H27-C3 TaxID=3046305 RepID=UPI0024BAE12E|nr:hypothetical protein [Streptomyces sp. H27-C3]MDJ0464422.1 hypothetical protein [Streptomyces sp. H27-C3]
MKPSRGLLIIALAAGMCALTTGTASAGWGEPDKSNGGAKTSGSEQNGTLTSLISYTGSTQGGSGKPGNVTPAGNWKPPACWYEPRSAKQFAEYVEGMYTSTINTPGQHSYAKSAVGMFRADYKEKKYKNYNLDKADEGSWWVAIRDEDRWLEPAAQICNEMPFWTVTGVAPNVPNAITPQVLAELAYNRLRLPDTKVDLAPEANTKVNLPTWAWLDESKFKPVEVTAQLNVNGLNLQATTTAEPVSLKLEPGTKDAALHPASGECTFNASGSIGEPFATGRAQETPPCGITYLRSSGNGTYKLQATVTWEISWTGTGSPRATLLPNGTFGNDQAVTVQEIQTINR